MKEFFKPEDFKGLFHEPVVDPYISIYIQAANKKLNEYLESCPVVLQEKDNSKWVIDYGVYRMHFFSKKARLFGIEEIKKEKCEHIPHQQVFIEGSYSQKFKCKLCHVELIATWSEKT